MKEKKAFKVGNVVTLKSGGSDMTIEKISFNEQNEQIACCVWQEKNKSVEKDYPTSVLKHAEENGVDFMLI